MRPHLVYGDIIYEQPNNESRNQKFERIQYNAAPVITGAIKKHLTKSVLNLLNLDVGLENYNSFIKSKQLE